MAHLHGKIVKFLQINFEKLDYFSVQLLHRLHDRLINVNRGKDLK